jgi:hypothetical protein
MLTFPAASLTEKIGTRALVIRKAMTIVRKEPVMGTVHPYEICARHLGQAVRPHVTSVRQ